MNPTLNGRSFHIIFKTLWLGFCESETPGAGACSLTASLTFLCLLFCSFLHLCSCFGVCLIERRYIAFIMSLSHECFRPQFELHTPTTILSLNFIPQRPPTSDGQITQELTATVSPLKPLNNTFADDREPHFQLYKRASSVKMRFHAAVVKPVQAGPVAYGICQAGCAAVVTACYAAAGFTWGATLGATAPASIIACNAAFGTCQAACAVVALAPTP